MSCKCPSCGTVIKRTPHLERQRGGVFECFNKEQCRIRIIGSLFVFVSDRGVNIDTITYSYIRQLYESGLVKVPGDLYKLTKSELTTVVNFSSYNADRVLEAINESLKTNPVALLGSIGIPVLGKRDLEIIVNYVGGIDAVMNFPDELFKYVPGIAKTRADNIVKFKNSIYGIAVTDSLKAVPFVVGEIKEPLEKVKVTLADVLLKSGCLSNKSASKKITTYFNDLTKLNKMTIDELGLYLGLSTAVIFKNKLTAVYSTLVKDITKLEKLGFM